jgi:lysophospholipase L1-like esterase
VKSLHVLALQTSYVSQAGDATANAKFSVAEKIHTWPFLTGVDVEASARGAAIVAFGSSLTDGDGTESDSNGRWPDVLAQQLQKSSGGRAELGVLNEGIIGNRLLNDSPMEAAGGRFGSVVGQAGLTRFDRDVLAQSGVKYVIVGLGINDIAMPGSLTPATEGIKAESIIAGYGQLISWAHRKGIRIIGTTNPPFENSFLDLGPPGLRSLSTVWRKKGCVRRSTPGFSAAKNLTAWWIWMRLYAIQVTLRNCSRIMTVETICIPTMQAAAPREMRFLSHCSRAIKLDSTHAASTSGLVRSLIRYFLEDVAHRRVQLPQLVDHRDDLEGIVTVVSAFQPQFSTGRSCVLDGTWRGC